VQPRDHDQFVTDFHSQQRLGKSRFDLACRAVASAKEEATRRARLPVPGAARLPRRSRREGGSSRPFTIERMKPTDSSV